jgi:hypothetical protein
VIFILAETYAKGCKICCVKEKKLEDVFKDESFPFPENKEELKEECREYLKKKGVVYSVHFKKKLIGLYVFKCENLDLILVHKISYNMEDIVRAEVEKHIKLLIHTRVVNRGFDRAVWENETIERDYVKQNPAPIILFLVLSIVNVIILVANLYFENKAVTAVVSTISAIAIIIVSIVYYRKYYNSK